MDLTKFRHKTKVQFRFSDFDMLGHVNNARYLTYLELARIYYFDEIVGTEIDWSKEGVILASATVDYLRPVEPQDKIEIWTRTSAFGNKSFEMEYAIVKVNAPEPVLMSKAKTTMVAFDYSSKTTIPVMKDWRDKIESYEKG